jgi:alpha-amylase
MTPWRSALVARELCLVTLIASTACSGASPLDARLDPAPDAHPGTFDASHVAFVQLFEWPWPDIARECEDHLGPRGFTAVQISPPAEHAWIKSGDGAPFPWWMRYQPVSYRLESRSGTRDQLLDMVTRCKAAGVAIYADVVVNHMAAGSGATSSAGASPWGNKRYAAVPYEPAHFHSTCAITDYGNAGNVQGCELSGLPDLDTGSAYVRGKLVDYLVDLTSLGVAGFRVDAAKHMYPGELAAIIDDVNAHLARQDRPRPFWFLEVIGAGGEAVQPSQYFGLSNGEVTVTEFGYGARLYSAFVTGKLAELRTLGEPTGLITSNHAVAFTDNHDKQRGHGGGGGYLTYHRGATYDLANVFMLAWPYGYPVVMSSYAFDTASSFDTSYGPPFEAGSGVTRGPWASGTAACGDPARGGWVCEHRFTPIANMVGFRAATMASWQVTDWWDNGAGQIAFGRGDRGFVVINRDADALTQSFHTSLAAGQYCDVISGELISGAEGGAAPACTGTVVTVDAQGNTSLTVQGLGAAAIHADAVLP